MEFRTVIDIPEYPFRIDHEQQGMLLGSCFATSIGQRMVRMKMPVVINPFGVVYNPLSIVRTLKMLEQGILLSDGDLTEHNDLWFTFSHHGSFGSTDKAEALKNINQSIEAGHDALHKSDYLILTLGTAWVYALVQTGKVVNNCHKLPSSAFQRYRLEVEEIVSALKALIQREPYCNKQVILTVSPVRHLKDGAAGNQFSKATLIVAANRLAERFEHVHYFPSYEIMMDDLRDYRFYDRDKVHPSDVAVDYIWERFSGALISRPSQELFTRIGKINAAREHRPFNPDAPRHQAFKKSVLAEIEAINHRYPSLDFSEETAYFTV